MSYAELMGFKKNFGFYDGPGGMPCQLTVITLPEATVTVTLGLERYTSVADASGYARFEVKNPGEWDVFSVKDDITQVGKIRIENVVTKIMSLPCRLEDLTWSEISAISRAGFASTNFALGDTKRVQINGETYRAQIIDFDHDDVSAEEAPNYGRDKAGITFCLDKVLRGAKRLHTANGSMTWNILEMRTTTLPALKNTMDADLADVLVPVLKHYRTTNNATTSVINTCTDQLFIPCRQELLGDYVNTIAGEGEQYEYFKDQAHRVRSDPDGALRTYWTRSLMTGQSGCQYIATTGLYGSYTSLSDASSRWCMPCFCV